MSPKAKRARRKRYAKNYGERFPHKVLCLAITKKAKAKGILHGQPCARCAATIGVQAHHDDYTRPLKIVWLCAPCHHAVEQELMPQKMNGKKRLAEMMLSELLVPIMVKQYQYVITAQRTPSAPPLRLGGREISPVASPMVLSGSVGRNERRKRVA